MNEISELVILLNDQNILCVDNKNNDEHSIDSHKQSSRNLEWYRQVLDEGRIVKFEYSGFNNLREIGHGGYGVVYSADYGDQKVALKQFTQNSIKNIANEIKQIYTVNNHENINRFHGITKDPNTNDFIMVLQFAKDGNLRDYLERQWDNDIFKISLTKIIYILEQIVQGLKHLHSNNIIHRDLHSRNIPINGERILIADFGLARELNCISSSSNIIGVPAYFDAMCLLQKLKPDKKSDIYSLGVIMWELTSGKPPFNKESLAEIIFKIVHGDREVAIPNYVTLYQKCWSTEPKQRPSLNEILGCLGEISKQADNKFITYNYRQISQRRLSTPSLIRDDSSSSNSSSDHSEYFSFYPTPSKQISIDTTNIITRSHAEKIAN
ncbi:kinase-like domain-containing protein [Gigaspora rosea]|uniref:Kinase-like domain-containing protein n=1 Tax=Gigaspora rosea TaxID=44941 RepID=A0A397W210_9GLOM|nr:kinase-like domain-containing protein [Gigaspora rosea]